MRKYYLEKLGRLRRAVARQSGDALEHFDKLMADDAFRHTGIVADDEDAYDFARGKNLQDKDGTFPALKSA